MIRNGYYYPVEFYRSLVHFDYEKGEPTGRAAVGVSMGNRKAGKTVGHGIEMIKRYTSNPIPERCMLLTRTDKDKKEGYLQKWWEKIFRINDQDGIIQKFIESHKIEYKPEVMLVDGDPFCYCEAISMSKKVKDTGSYDRCTSVILDEAIQEGESSLWIAGRPAISRIFEIWQTVARGWDEAANATCLIFISNCSERDNWIFNDLKINEFVRKDTKFTTQHGITVEIVDNVIASKEIELSLMGGVMQRSEAGRSYYESATHNTFQDNESFVEPRGLDFRQLEMQLVYQGSYIGIFRTEDGLHAAKIQPDGRSPKICNDILYHSDDVSYEKYGDYENRLRLLYKADKITFQTLEAKTLFLKYVSLK